MNTVLFIMVGLSLPDIVRRLPRQELVRGFVLIPIIYLAMVSARFVGHHAIIFSIRALDRRPQQRERRTNIRGRLVSTVAEFRGDRLPGDHPPRHRGRTAGRTDRDGVRPPELPARRLRPPAPGGPPRRWPRPSTR